MRANDALEMMRDRSAAKSSPKVGITSPEKANTNDAAAAARSDMQGVEKSDNPDDSPTRKRTHCKKRPAAAPLSARVLKKPTAVPAVSGIARLEITRNQYQSWTGKRGPGQYKSFRFDEGGGKSQQLAEKAAHAWISKSQ